MSRSNLPCRAIQHLARIAAAVLLITISICSVIVIAGYDAQATPKEALAAVSAPTGEDTVTSREQGDTKTEGEQPDEAQETAGQPVQAEIPSAVQTAAAQADQSSQGGTGTADAQPEREGALPASAPVDDSWFADAAFVGDSRTEGLLLYSGLKAGGGFAHRGLTVQSARSDRVITVNGQTCTAVEALAQGSYSKVYLMLGVNELGWYNDTRYENNYAQLIDLVREAQPDAQIYLQTLIPVTAEKSASSYVNNPQILVYNEIITRLAQEKGVYLVDVWSAFAGEDGALDAEGSVDGVHLTRPYYVKWLDYLKTHTAP